MRIYEISGCIGGDQHWQFATSIREAKIYIAGIKAEFPEAADRVELTFNAVDFPPGSEGTVEALNWFIGHLSKPGLTNECSRGYRVGSNCVATIAVPELPN